MFINWAVMSNLVEILFDWERYKNNVLNNLPWIILFHWNTNKVRFLVLPSRNLGIIVTFISCVCVCVCLHAQKWLLFLPSFVKWGQREASIWMHFVCAFCVSVFQKLHQLSNCTNSHGALKSVASLEMNIFPPERNDKVQERFDAMQWVPCCHFTNFTSDWTCLSPLNVAYFRLL